MTRKEYIEALDQYLVTMSASEKADILSDYEEHFRVGLENGKTESQIAASLGTPYDVANQFLDGQKPSVPTYPAHTAATASAPTTAPRPATAAPAQSYATTAQRPATAAPAQSYATTAQRPATAAPAQSYATTAQRPATAAPAQSYTTTAQRPATAAPAQSYATTAQRPTSAAPSQNNPYQQNLPPYGSAQSPQRAGQYEVYDVGIQNYRTAPEARSPYPNSNSGYVDYDRQTAERAYQTQAPKAESKYNSTGIIVVIALCVVLIPTVGGTIVGLLVGLYGSIIAFATTGGSLIAVGTALSASSVWICVGLFFIGISFLALTGLLIMAAIEGTKLFVKLIRYCVKECKKMITEGSF